jgi:hypothetical protein
MNSSRLKKNEGSNEQASSFCLLAHTTDTSQNPSWHARHDSKTDRKSSNQRLTMMNNSEQISQENGLPRDTEPHQTTTKAGDHERED